jgi:hypothetical protein
VAHAGLEPEQWKGAQMFPGPTWEALSTVQLPLLDAPSDTAQTLQLPLQAVLQQKPSTQLPEEHWRFDVHVLPVAFAVEQTPELQ